MLGFGPIAAAPLGASQAGAAVPLGLGELSLQLTGTVPVADALSAAGVVPVAEHAIAGVVPVVVLQLAGTVPPRLP